MTAMEEMAPHANVVHTSLCICSLSIPAVFPVTEMLRILLFLSVGVVAKVFGLPDGAPQSSCLDLTPRHPKTFPQPSFPPYQVLPAAGQGRVRLILGSPQGLAYEGFLIFARDIDTGEYVGEFTNLPDSARIVECTPGVKVREVF